MSYPYPQDRTRDKRTKGDALYEDAREAYGENEADTARAADEREGRATSRTDEDQERDAEERFEHIGENVADEPDAGDES